MRVYFLLFIHCFVSVIATNNTRATMKRSYGEHRLVSYIVDWEIPESIDWSKLDHVAYAFAEPDSEGNLETFTPEDLRSVVSQAHENGVGASLSVGGWSGSKYFSPLVKSSSKRETLVNNIVSMVEEYDLDGINVDWEYPNNPDGSSQNIMDPSDTDNYLVFLQELRSKLDSEYPSTHKVITLAVDTTVFNDEDQVPLEELDDSWAETVDYFYVMAYDVSGIWNQKTGPNAPLLANPNYDTSVAQSVSDWHDAGIPKHQLIVGVPFYGTAFKTVKPVSAATSPYVGIAGKSNLRGDKYDELTMDSFSGSKEQIYSGTFEWRSIVERGIDAGRNGWRVFWDMNARTPYAYQKSTRKYISYDNVKSMKEKADFVNDHDLGGIMVWSLEMDDDSSSLLESLQSVRE